VKKDLKLNKKTNLIPPSEFGFDQFNVTKLEPISFTVGSSGAPGTPNGNLMCTFNEVTSGALMPFAFTAHTLNS